jgi:hypothetical protein
MEVFEPALSPRLVLSDRVIREEGTGKLSLIGCFEMFLAPAFPFHAPLFFVTAGITNIIGTPEEMNITVRIEDPESGHVIASSAVKMTKPPGYTPDFPRDGVLEIPLPFDKVRFEVPATYSVVCLFSNEVIGSRLFAVRALTHVAS